MEGERLQLRLAAWAIGHVPTDLLCFKTGSADKLSSGTGPERTLRRSLSQPGAAGHGLRKGPASTPSWWPLPTAQVHGLPGLSAAESGVICPGFSVPFNAADSALALRQGGQGPSELGEKSIAPLGLKPKIQYDVTNKAHQGYLMLSFRTLGRPLCIVMPPDVSPTQVRILIERLVAPEPSQSSLRADPLDAELAFLRICRQERDLRAARAIFQGAYGTLVQEYLELLTGVLAQKGLSVSVTDRRMWSDNMVSQFFDLAAQLESRWLAEARQTLVGSLMAWSGCGRNNIINKQWQRTLRNLSPDGRRRSLGRIVEEYLTLWSTTMIANLS
jgi:hypothetical protein